MYTNYGNSNFRAMCPKALAMDKITNQNAGKPINIYQTNDYFCVCIPKSPLASEQAVSPILGKAPTKEEQLLIDCDISIESCSLTQTQCVVLITCYGESVRVTVGINPVSRCGYASTVISGITFRVEVCLSGSEVCARACAGGLCTDWYCFGLPLT